ncbi:peptidoglycan-binding domain-containing protein [Variovorax paradoxus]|uniref:peptidoglycan-binding domain-containing protein n=1 Tax=Variovorax paradoxus TaxID=34073 RepID=UPI001F5F0246|nr:peptidoglycan-binding domain-containing protein [Variovorax paradoxus]
MGYASADGKAIKADGSFGPGTRDFVKAFQHDNHLKPDGVAGPGTLQAIDAKLKERVAPSQQGQITDAHHAGNALYKQAKSGLEKIDAEFGRKPDQLTDNAAAAIAVAALRGGLTRIDHMTLGGNDNSTIFAIQGKPGAVLSKFVDVPTVESMHTPVTQSSQAFAYVQQIQQQQAPQQSNQQAAQHAAPAMAR